MGPLPEEKQVAGNTGDNGVADQNKRHENEVANQPDNEGAKDSGYGSETSAHEYKTLDWPYVRDSYAFVGKAWLGSALCLLITGCPFWIASRFVRNDYRYTQQEFAEECQADPDTPFQDKSVAFWMAARFIPYVFFFSLMAFVGLRVEKFRDVDDQDPEVKKRVSGIRNFWSCFVVFFMCFGCGIRFLNVAPKDNFINWAISVFCSLLACSCIITSIVRQGQSVHKKWFETWRGLVAGVIVCFAVMIANILIISYGNDILFAYGAQGQLGMLLFANVLDMLLKHFFAQSTMEKYFSVCWILFITACFHVPIRLYTFVLPDVSSILMANLVNFGTGVAGQVWNYFYFSFRLKYLKAQMEEKYVLVINMQQIHELYVSHMCNIVAFLVVLCADPRYYSYSPLVDTGYVLKPGFFAMSVALAVFTELIKDAIMLKLTTQSLPFINMPKYCKTKAMREVFLPFSIGAICVSTLYSNGIRLNCLLCGDGLGDACLNSI